MSTKNETKPTKPLFPPEFPVSLTLVIGCARGHAALELHSPGDFCTLHLGGADDPGGSVYLCANAAIPISMSLTMLT